MQRCQTLDLAHWHTGTPTQLRYRTRPLDTDQGEEGLNPWEIICNTWRILWQTVRNCHSVLGIYWQPILGSWQIMHVPGIKSSPGFIFPRVLFYDQIIIKSCFHLTRFDQIIIKSFIWPKTRCEQKATKCSSPNELDALSTIQKINANCKNFFWYPINTSFAQYFVPHKLFWNTESPLCWRSLSAF